MGAQEIGKGAIRRIYALGAQLGIKGQGRDDALHALVLGLTGKESVKALTPAEGQQVEQELRRRMAAAKRPYAGKKSAENKKARPHRPGMATPGQIDKLWWQMYELQKLDVSPNETPVPARLRGAIMKELQVDAPSKDPCRWLTQEQASELINKLNRYIISAKKKARNTAQQEADHGR